MTRLLHDYDGQCADCTTALMENHRLLTLIDATDRHVADQRAEIVRLQLQCDAMAAQVANLEDTRWRRHAERRLVIMHNVAPWLAAQTFGHGKERDAALALLTEVALHAEKPAHVQAWRVAHERWEARRK